MKNNGKSVIVWILAIVLMIVCVSVLFAGTGAKEISYDKMYGMFLKEEVVKYQIDRNQTIYLETKDGTIYQHDLADRIWGSWFSSSTKRVLSRSLTTSLRLFLFGYSFCRIF